MKPEKSTNRPPFRLTKREIEALRFEGSPFVQRDTGVPGLMIYVGGRGKTWKVQRDMRTGDPAKPVATLKHTLGSFPEISVDKARSEALAWIAKVKQGVNPSEPTPATPKVWTVERMFSEYAADLGKREKSERTVADLLRLAKGYLSDWMPLPITAVTREMARERHAHVTTANGPVVANQALRAFRTCFNFAKRVTDTPLGENPVDAVTFTPERSANRSIAPVDLPGWHGRLAKVSNPLRRLMHEIGLFSGLRPGNLVSLERAWINLERKAIVIPAERMKARREFALPLSGHLIGLIKRALVLSHETESGSPWLFPTRSADGKTVKATQVWKELTRTGEGGRAVALETGHLLRHTYSNVARLAGVDDVDRELLLAHKIPGVQGVYLDAPTLFSRLLEQQEKVTAHLLSLINPQPK